MYLCNHKPKNNPPIYFHILLLKEPTQNSEVKIVFIVKIIHIYICSYLKMWELLGVFFVWNTFNNLFHCPKSSVTVFFNVLHLFCRSISRPTTILLTSLSTCDLLTGLVITGVGVYPALLECWPFGQLACRIQVYRQAGSTLPY